MIDLIADELGIGPDRIVTGTRPARGLRTSRCIDHVLPTAERDTRPGCRAPLPSSGETPSGSSAERLPGRPG